MAPEHLSSRTATTNTNRHGPLHLSTAPCSLSRKQLLTSSPLLLLRSDVAALCGTRLPGHPDYVEMNITEPTHEELGLDASLTVADLPTDFDWRTQGKGCDAVIGLVRDQSSCGSCWAMSASEAFTDRRCVLAKDTKIYSSMDVASCCHGFSCGMSQGCNGGQQGAALGWISKTGVVTGGNYDDMNTGKECKDYSFATCAHHVPASPGHPACPKAEYKTPKCEQSCTVSAESRHNSISRDVSDRLLVVNRTPSTRPPTRLTRSRDPARTPSAAPPRSCRTS